MSPASEDASEPHTAVPAVYELAHQASIPSSARSRSGMTARWAPGYSGSGSEEHTGLGHQCVAISKMRRRRAPQCRQ